MRATLRTSIAPLPPYVMLPLWAIRILALAGPIWGAWTGQLTVFQLIWVFWIEAWLAIPFLIVRIAAARGPYRQMLTGALETAGSGVVPEIDMEEAVRTATIWERIRLAIGLVLIRGGLLLFYALFIILFILLQVTSDEAMVAGVETMAFRNPWANSVWAAFVVQHTLELVAYFFLNGAWRTASPRAPTFIFDRNTVLMHVMIVSTVMLHQFVFKEKDYAAKGEVVYVALFCLVRLAGDVIARRIGNAREQRNAEFGEPVGI